MKALFSLILSIGLLTSCKQEPEPIIYGQDACEHCKMTIMDQKYGAEIVTAKGKVLKFDAVECMVGFVKESSEKFSDKDLILTTNLALPGTLIPADKAFFLKDRAFQSPMGGNLASFESRQLAENNLQHSDGKILSWNDLLTK